MNLTKFEISSKDKEIVTFLLNEIQHEYLISINERNHIHNMEWESNDSDTSLLGCVELFSDYICGIALSLLKNKYNQMYCEKLPNKSIHHSATIHKFVKDQSTVYPKYTAYILSIEHLRAIIQRILSCI